MATKTATSPTGIEYDGTNHSLKASHDTMVAILGTAERMWNRALDWSGDHPYHFLGILILIGLCVTQSRKGRTEDTALKNQFKAYRDEQRSKAQQDLPLSLPRERENDHH